MYFELKWIVIQVVFLCSFFIFLLAKKLYEKNYQKRLEFARQSMEELRKMYQEYAEAGDAKCYLITLTNPYKHLPAGWENTFYGKEKYFIGGRAFHSLSPSSYYSTELTDEHMRKRSMYMLHCIMYREVKNGYVLVLEDPFDRIVTKPIDIDLATAESYVGKILNVDMELDVNKKVAIVHCLWKTSYTLDGASEELSNDEMITGSNRVHMVKTFMGSVPM